MKKVYITLSLAAATMLTCAAQTKFDTYSLGVANFYQEVKAQPGANHITPVELPFEMAELARSGKAETAVIIKLAPGMSVDDIRAAGLDVTCVIGDQGDMCIAQGDMDDILALDNNDAVEAMSLSAPLRMHLDKAREGSSVTAVHNGTGLPKAYTGKGVVCGIYDSGIDPNHINFYDRDFKETRVKQVNWFSGNSTTPIVYNGVDRISSFTTDAPKETHGTHTLGCMTGAFMKAGNGSNSNTAPVGKSSVYTASGTITALNSTKNPYYGTAPDADIVVGCGSLSNAQTIAAVQQVVDYATQHNQPAVVNLSLGNNQGSHDGTGTFGQAMTRLSKNAIICVSSGNEGDQNISIIKTFTASDNQLKTVLNVSSTSTGILDIYGSDKNKFNFTVAVINKSNGNVMYSRQFNDEGSSTLSTSTFTTAGHIHDAQFDNAFTNSYVIASVSNNAGTSGRHSISLQYSLTPNSATNASCSNYVLAVICQGNAGQRVDIVNSVVSGNGKLDNCGLAGYSAGTPDLTINELACSPDVIAVGAWTSRTAWPSLSRNQYWFGEKSPFVEGTTSYFTSYGVLYDGRELPDICAPGAGIVSSISSYYTDLTDPSGSDPSATARYEYKKRNYTWNCESGTSMASPFCAGVIATWLEADPTLTVDRVKKILKETADPLTGKPVQSGPGKLNAYNGLKAVLNAAGAVNDVRVDDEILVKAYGKTYEVFVPGGNIHTTVYNMSGQPVKTAKTTDNTLNLDLNSLSKGVYLLNVNGVHTERIAIN